MNRAADLHSAAARGGAAVRGALLHLLLLAFACLSLLPFAWLVCSTFKQREDFFAYPFLTYPHIRLGPDGKPVAQTLWETLTLSNYRLLFTRYPFARWLFNSLFLSSTHTLCVVTLSSLGGFALAKYRFAGKKPLMGIMLATMLLPSQVLLSGAYQLMYKIGWLDSYAAIIVPGAVSVFGIFLFMQAMRAVPDELLQAGRVDGCSELRLWWEVALPIVRPMIGAYTLLSFMGTWNSFMWPQIVLQSQSKYTLPIGLANMMNVPEFFIPYGMLMAGTLLSIVPLVILFFVLQRDFIAGLTSGAVKG
jgi:multiple sugar transport system permease protein